MASLEIQINLNLNEPVHVEVMSYWRRSDASFDVSWTSFRFHVPAGKRKAFTSDLPQKLYLKKSFPPPPKIPLSKLLNGGCHCS